MTVAVTLSEGKPPFGGTIPTQEETCPKSACSIRIKNSYLRSKSGILQIAQILFGIVALALIRRTNEYIISFLFMYLTFSSSLLSAAILWDGLSDGKLRKVFDLQPAVWTKWVLYFTGIAGFLYCLNSIGMVGFFIWVRIPETNILAGVCGIFACLAYAYNWFVLYKAWIRAGQEQNAMEQSP
ncbi:uncharacterized protein LOC131689573 [Topomyia yanbarensis]|uniref:uncharacterized protein LOC131689573 n=1 Tax=Topomyia yanbarensis TaxID=2498891 RepID=UPI00273BAF9A|nr:uncharacterized protein LOC131689573 [Topomyia yanbarensis]